MMPVPKAIYERAKHTRLLICDVDGVLTSGEVYLDDKEGELKSFNIKDGLGIKMLLEHGIQVAIITGRNSPTVSRRMAELGIELYYQGQRDKQAAFDELLAKCQVQPEEVAYIGDDLPDLPLMKQSGIGLCPADAHPFVAEKSTWVLNNQGGRGAVRELADILLAAQGHLDEIYKGFWPE